MRTSFIGQLILWSALKEELFATTKVLITMRLFMNAEKRMKIFAFSKSSCCPMWIVWAAEINQRIFDLFFDPRRFDLSIKLLFTACEYLLQEETKTLPNFNSLGTIGFLTRFFKVFFLSLRVFWKFNFNWLSDKLSRSRENHERRKLAVNV